MPGIRSASLAAAVVLLAPAGASAQTVAGGTAGPAIGYAAALLAHGDLLFVGRTAVVAGFPMPSAAPGAVYVYRRSGSEWVEMAVLRAQEGTVGDGFGSSMAYDGTLLAIGAPEDAKRKGAVYIFARGGGSTWRQLARLVVPGGVEGDRFGASVALQGNTAIFGAPGRESGKGAAWVARPGARGWVLAETLAPADRDSTGAFGRAVALVAPHAFVSAPGPQGGFAFGPSAPPIPGRIYAWSVGTNALREAGRLAPTDTAVRAFGAALALSGEVLFAGAPRSSRGTGAVFRYARQDGQWVPAGVLRADSARPGSGTGAAIALAGADVLVGAPTMRQGKGSILVFRESDGRWKETQQLEPRTTGLAGLAGASLTATGNYAVAGAPFSEFFEGIGFVYAKDGATWTERARLMDAEPGLPAITGREHRCDTGSVSVFQCQQVDLLSFIPTRSLGAPRGVMLNGIWGWTDSETRREYALVGRMDGTAFVDVTDPSNPVYVAEVPLTEGAQPNLWREIKVYKNHAYIVSDGAGPHGMQVFDLTRLRDVADKPATLRPDTVYHGIHSAHNIVINEETGYAYTVGNSMGGETCGGALHMIDIREPRAPKFVGCYADPLTGNQKTGYTHDAQCVTYRGPDQAYRGREICFNASETALGIADVTDKTAPKALSHVSHPNNAYTHQGWLSEDQRFFFVNDEGDEIAGTVPRTRTVVYDVSDLDDPTVATEYLGETSASDHNLYVRGRYMFESNYVAGLRVIDVADPMHPKEVGYFDTVPFGENTPGFAGTWSNYPFFPSGTIVVSSMREGLFVVRHRPEQPVP